MSNNVNKNNSAAAELDKKNEAYETLKNWVKSLPETLKDLENKPEALNLISIYRRFAY